MSAKDDAVDTSLLSHTDSPFTTNEVGAKGRVARIAPVERVAPGKFPPKPDYSSLSVHDLLDAREQYHVYLSKPGKRRSDCDRTLSDSTRETGSPSIRPTNRDPTSEPSCQPSSIDRQLHRAALVLARGLGVRQQAGARSKSFGRNDGAQHALFERRARGAHLRAARGRPTNLRHLPFPGPSHTSSMLGGGYSCLRKAPGEWQHTWHPRLPRQPEMVATTHSPTGTSPEVRAKRCRPFFRGEYHRVGCRTRTSGSRRATMRRAFSPVAGKPHPGHPRRWPRSHRQHAGLDRAGLRNRRDRRDLRRNRANDHARPHRSPRSRVRWDLRASSKARSRLFSSATSRRAGSTTSPRSSIGPRTGTSADHDRRTFHTARRFWHALVLRPAEWRSGHPGLRPARGAGPSRANEHGDFARSRCNGAASV